MYCESIPFFTELVIMPRLISKQLTTSSASLLVLFLRYVKKKITKKP